VSREVAVASIEKRNGKYRVRYRDPSARNRSRTFLRKSDADIDRGDWIQARMGHSTITVTLDRYGHLFPELDEAIAVAFDQRWTEARAAAGVA
jgi:integrase